ncbi:MAG: LamG-like jellyroll fold domain-containing protein [Bacteroidota bacterium]
MPTKDVNKLLKGSTDVVLAAVDESSAASPAQVGDSFPLLSLDFVEADSIQSEDKKLTMTEAGGGTLQLGQITSVSVKTMSETGAAVTAARKFKNARCNIYGFGSQQSHRIDKFLMNVETPMDMKKDGKSGIIFSGERKVSPDDLLGSIGQTPTAFSSDAAYKYNQFIKNIRQENLVFAFLPYLGNFGQTAKAYDASDNRITGSLLNGPAWGSAPDTVNSKLTFDGVNDYADFGDIHDDDGVSDLLFECWVKILGADASHQRVLCKASNPLTPTVGYGIYRESTNRMKLIISDGTLYASGTTASNVLQNVWAHFAVSVDRNGNIQTYLAGAANGSPASVTSVASAANGISLCCARDVGNYGNIEIGAIRLYNYGAGGLPANIAAIIADHYNAEKAIFGL